MASHRHVDDFAFHSGSFAQGDRFGAYRDLYSAGSDVDLGGPGFAASMRARRSTEAVVFERFLNDVSHERTPKRVRADGLEHFVLNICLSGSVFFHTQERSIHLEAGEAALVHVARAYRNEARDARIITVAIAREWIEEHLADPDTLHGVVGRDPAYVGLGEALSAFVRDGGGSGVEPASVLAEAVRLIRPRASMETAVSVAARRANKIEQAKRAVEGALATPGLAPETIAEEIGVSRSTLFDLFATWGGVSRYIQTRRLQRLRFALSTAGERRTFLDLAQAHGFVSEAHASRRFSEAFRTAPSRFRFRTGAAFDPRPGSVIYGWVHDLNDQDVRVRA